MGGHAATPNSEVTEHVSPASKNSTASYEGTEGGEGGNSPAGADASEERIISRA